MSQNLCRVTHFIYVKTKKRVFISCLTCPGSVTSSLLQLSDHPPFAGGTASCEGSWVLDYTVCAFLSGSSILFLFLVFTKRHIILGEWSEMLLQDKEAQTCVYDLLTCKNSWCVLVHVTVTSLWLLLQNVTFSSSSGVWQPRFVLWLWQPSSVSDVRFNNNKTDTLQVDTYRLSDVLRRPDLPEFQVSWVLWHGLAQLPHKQTFTVSVDSGGYCYTATKRAWAVGLRLIHSRLSRSECDEWCWNNSDLRIRRVAAQL